MIVVLQVQIWLTRLLTVLRVCEDNETTTSKHKLTNLLKSPDNTWGFMVQYERYIFTLLLVEFKILSRVEGKMSRVESKMSRVEGKMSRVQFFA